MKYPLTIRMNLSKDFLNFFEDQLHKNHCFHYKRCVDKFCNGNASLFLVFSSVCYCPWFNLAWSNPSNLSRLIGSWGLKLVLDTGHNFMNRATYYTMILFVRNWSMPLSYGIHCIKLIFEHQLESIQTQYKSIREDNFYSPIGSPHFA